jgi:hypothetical protein
MRKGRARGSELNQMQRAALRAWDRLEARRARVLNDLRSVEKEIEVMYPAVAALVGPAKDAA